MKNLFKIIFIVAIMLTGVTITSGQQSPDSLLKYLEIAAKNNPTVLQRFTEYEAALQKIPQVGSLPDPQLDLGVFVTPMELVSGNQVADLRLMQMFPWFGVLKNAKDEMSLMAKAKFELFRDAKLQVYYDVQRTWYELFRIKKDIEISEKNVDILKVIEQLALIKYKSPTAGNAGPASPSSGMISGSSRNLNSGVSSGMQSMGGNQLSQSSSSATTTASMQSNSMSTNSDGSGLSDLYRIQIESGDLKNNIAYLKNQEQSVTARFNSYLNRPLLSPVFKGDILISDSLNLPLTAISDSIRLNNPMLSMLDLEQQAYQARKKMVTRMGYPMVGLGLNYSIISKSDMSSSSMNGKDMIMPMVSMTLPIYRKKYNAMQAEAELLSKASSENLQATANSLQAEYYTAVQLYQDAKRRQALYADQFQLASKSLEIMLKSFSTSSATLTDVLRVRQQTLDYELKQVEAVTDLNTATAWLNRLMALSKNK